MRGAALALALLLAWPAQARPAWAEKADSADDGGHTFFCEGQGKTEEDAVAAAQAICDDKVCKVCGVEVESITTTSETLHGVELSRKVVERCKRARQHELHVKRKSADCDEAAGAYACSAWIEVLYPKDDEQAECSSYTKEEFADPALCEQDVDAFRDVKGRSADSFRERTRALDAALAHCARIDVRPTPALLALDAKLRDGMDAFELTEQMQDRLVAETHVDDPWMEGASSQREAALRRRPAWAFYLTTDPALRRQISESKLLAQRLQLVRDYVANRALVFDVLEAARSRQLDSPAGVERLRAALEKAPVGGQYGSDDVHFPALSAFNHPASDTSSIGALVRKLYPPAALPRGEAWNVALFFHEDGRTTQEEWDYIFAAEQTSLCVECLRVLLESPDHGSMETRLARFDQAYAFVVPRMRGKVSEVRAFTELVGHTDAGLLLGALARVPGTVAPQLGWGFLSSAVEALDRNKGPAPDRAALLAKVVALEQASYAAAQGKELENDCIGLAARLKTLDDAKADTAPLADAVCGCLTGPLRNELHLVNRNDLVRWAQPRKLGCLAGLPQEPQ